MDFLHRLENVNKEQRDVWNDDIEDYLSKPQPPSQNSVAKELDVAALQSSLESVALDLQTQLEATPKTFETNQCNIGATVRTGKNLLRWYIQIYLVQLQGHKNHDDSKLDVLRSPGTLSNVFEILKSSAEDSKSPKIARDASLYIFYATYSHFSGDKLALTGMDHLIAQHNFPTECLDILMRVNDVSLALTIVRNLHSMTISFPSARKSILDATIAFDPSIGPQTAPWAPKETSVVDFSQTCLALMRWSLNADRFFDNNPENKGVELIVEILNCFYAMRKGQELAEPSTDSNKDDDSPSLVHLIVQIIQLDSHSCSITENHEETISKRIDQCQLSAISLLMDSDVSFGKYLVEIGSFDRLLEIFKHQVDDVVDNTKVDSTATATLVPILVVLNRYAMANSVVQRKIKTFVLPSETEKIILQSMKENQKAKMSPLDAPKDTLRGKMIVLLSWVDGYIKRCSAELMWTLCDSNSSQFTHCVGLGNALPLLNSKGLSPIPIPT